MNRSVVKAGTCILTEEPFVYNLSSKYRSTRCDFCLKNPIKLFKCSGCCYVYYCGAQCQTTAWAEHKQECGRIKVFLKTTDHIPDGLRMMAKLVLKVQHGGYSQRSFYSKTDSRKFRDLMTHEKEIKEDQKRMDYFETCLMPFLQWFFEEHPTILPSTKEILQIYGKMAVNSFNVLDSEMNSIGTAMYLAASILDHNCQPNAVATFDGPKLNIRTTVDMPYLNWDNVFISYIDLIDDTETRRGTLKKNYYFLCTCSKCVLHDKDEVNLYPALCPQCRSPYYVSQGSCSNGHCYYVATKEFKDEYQEITDFSKFQITQMSNTAYLDMAKVCLRKQEKVLHPINLLYVKVLDIAFESSITLEKFEEAAVFGKMLLPGFMKYQGEMNPLVGVLCLKVGKILDYLGQSNEAEDFLRDAERILKVTHGEGSEIYKESLMPLLMHYK